jgi:ADP-ribose pyrophosphatase
MIQPWKRISSKPAGDFRIFSIRTDRKVSPRTNNPHDFYVIDCVNWVNVVAVTPDHKMVMVEQYRHGSNSVELEIPGGMMDAEDVTPEVTAVRELREETGYQGDQVRVIGRVLPNPAIMSNVCFTVLIENCQCVHPVEFDHGEDLLTKLVPVSEVPGLVATGKIQHSLVIAGLYCYELQKRGS